MNYYSVVIQLNSAGESTQAVYKYATLAEATASFHTEMAYGINAKLKAVTCLVLNAEGGVLLTDHWDNPDQQ